MKKSRIQDGKRYIAEFKEKHGTFYFVVLTSEELDAVCLYMLGMRNNQGWYRQPEPIAKENIPSYSLAEAELLKSPAKEAALQQIKYYQRRLDDNSQDQESWERIQTALQTKNGQLAYDVLAERSDYEYERFTLHISGNWKII